MSILMNRERRMFDPLNPADLKEYKHFIKHSKWKTGCPFKAEWPHNSIPDMIKTKLINHYYDVIMEKANQLNKEKKGNYVTSRV